MKALSLSPKANVSNGKETFVKWCFCASSAHILLVFCLVFIPILNNLIRTIKAAQNVFKAPQKYRIECERKRSKRKPEHTASFLVCLIIWTIDFSIATAQNWNACEVSARKSPFGTEATLFGMIVWDCYTVRHPRGSPFVQFGTRTSRTTHINGYGSERTRPTYQCVLHGKLIQFHYNNH